MLARVIGALALVSTVGLLLARAQDAPAPAVQDTRIGDWVFAMPKGMKVVASATDGMPALRPGCSPDSQVSEAVLRDTVKIEGSFRKWFSEQWATVKSAWTWERVSEPAGTASARKYDMLVAGGRGKANASGEDRVVLFAGLHKAGRAATLLFTSDDFERMDQIVLELDAVLGSTTFASLRAEGEPAPTIKLHIDARVTPSFLWDKPPEWPKGDYPLEGVWAYSSLDPEYVYGGGWSVRTRWHYLIFFRDGRALRRMPPEGLHSFSFDWWKPQLLDYCGTYKVHGDSVEITWEMRDGQTHKQTVTRSGDDLKDHSRVFRRPPRDGAKLQGRYLTGIRNKQDAESVPGMTFREDGTFVDEGMLWMFNTSWWCGGDYWLNDGKNQTGGKGTWRVADWTLELIYEDGRKRRFGFHLDPADPGNAKVLSVNGQLIGRHD